MAGATETRNGGGRNSPRRPGAVTGEGTIGKARDGTKTTWEPAGNAPAWSKARRAPIIDQMLSKAPPIFLGRMDAGRIRPFGIHPGPKASGCLAPIYQESLQRLYSIGASMKTAFFVVLFAPLADVHAAWAPPFAPAAPQAMASLQAFIGGPAGAGLPDELRAYPFGSPERSLASGALAERVLEMDGLSSPERFQAARAAAAADVAAAFRARAGELAKAFVEGRIGRRGLSEAAREMRRLKRDFSPIYGSFACEAADAVEGMARAARSEETEAKARDIAGKLLARSGEIFLVRLLPDSDGRAPTGIAQGKAIEELAGKYGGRVRVLKGEGASSLFQSEFAVEADASAREEALRDLRGVAGAEAHPLSVLVEAGSRLREDAALDAKGLAAINARLKEGPLPGRMEAFSELASALESARASAIAALPEDLRDGSLHAVYGLAGFLANSFNLVHSDARKGLRRKEWASRGGWDGNDFAVEKIVREALKDPGLRGRFDPLRKLFTRVLGVLVLLDTPESRSVFTHWMPFADYAGLELVASRPGLRKKFIQSWLAAASESVAETLAGLGFGEDRPDGWTGSSHSGGYEHLDGYRNSLHLYQWRPYRHDPAEERQDAWLLLGLGAGGDLVGQAIDLLESEQWKIPEMDALNREAMRNYGSYEKVEGQSVLDRMLTSLYYTPYHALLPGFDEAAFVSSALDFYAGALARLAEPGMVKQLVDSAVSFVLSLAREPLLDSRPELRLRATDIWRLASAKCAELGLRLLTRLDGVIDPRPQRLLGEPLDYSGNSGGRNGSVVWQLSESPDGRFLARAGADRTVLVWEASTGRLLKTIRLEDARQYYGDLDNSLGAAWTPDGKLLAATLHDAEGGSGVFQKVRAFDLSDPRPELGPGDALFEATLPGVAILRHMPAGPSGQYAAAFIARYEKGGPFGPRLAGSDVRLFSLKGEALSKIDGASLLDARGARILTGAPFNAPAGLRLFDASDPSSPRDATPAWMKDWAAGWKSRNGPRARLSARLGSFEGREVIAALDAHFLKVLDLSTGDELRSVEIPNAWDARAFALSDGGSFLAAAAEAPGNFYSPRPQRLMVWDLSKGELVMERESRDVSELAFSATGGRLFAAGRDGVSGFELP
jgi:WD40 repeat protein